MKLVIIQDNGTVVAQFSLEDIIKLLGKYTQTMDCEAAMRKIEKDLKKKIQKM